MIACRHLGLLGLVACSEPTPEWLPPPADAAATCIYERLTGSIRQSTVYFDALNRMIQVDGYALDDDADAYRASYSFDYDEQSRLVRANGPYEDVRFTYSEQQIVATDANTNDEYAYDLADGRVTVYQGPLRLPEAERQRASFEYDSTGRITRRRSTNGSNSYDWRYTYDDQGRLATAARDERTATIVYTEALQQMLVDVDTFDGLFTNRVRWTIDYDEDQRLKHIVIDPRPGYSFTYSDGVWRETRDGGAPGSPSSTTATGQCPPPALTFAPQPMLPLRPYVMMVEPQYPGEFWLASLP